MDFDGRRRVVILAVRPVIDGGRYPVKRVIGEPLEVEADLVADGHDIVTGVVRVVAPDKTSLEVPLIAAGNDTYKASVELSRLGRYRFAIAAWVDHFASWRRGLERKHLAGTDVSVELLEGALLVEAAVVRGAPLGDVVKLLRGSQSVAERVAIALAPSLADDMARYPDRTFASESVTELEVVVERKAALYSAWYEFFPRSVTGKAGEHGSLRDAESRLAYAAELGFDVVYLPPIHPIGIAYRKGKDNAPTASPDDVGSPWAIGAREGGHTAIHPQLGTLDDFDRFVAKASTLGIEIALDIAFQASPDHPWVKEHPTWFKARPDGSIQYAENPPKKYQDVYPFDFESADWRGLWAGLRDVFLFWAARGVRAFRVDNPHTKALPFWEWCIREVQSRYPDSIFLAEAFTRPKLTYALAKGGFSQSYTYFTWRTTKPELTRYLEELTQTELVDQFRPNFWPTTPDIFPEYLAHGGRAAFVSRLVLASTLSASYGIYGPSYELMERTPRAGVEELAQNEKYQLRTWDLDRPDSLRHVMARLNRIRHAHPALHGNRSLRFHPIDNDHLIAYSKRNGDDTILVIVNLDSHHVHRGWTDLDLGALGLEDGSAFQVHDLLGDARFTWHGRRNFIELDPGAMPAHIFAVRRFVRTENQFEYFL